VREVNMTDFACTTTYFGEPGEANTDRTLEIARQRAEELDIRTILVASTQGTTGAKAAQLFADREVVVVTHSTGLKKPNFQELREENRAQIKAAGATILTCQHALGGVNRAIRRKLGTYEVDEIIAYTLRTFGQGMKVCVEIALMAADAGLLRVDEPCIAIAGTGRGADTAVVLTPAIAQDFFDLKIHEILCKPRLA